MSFHISLLSFTEVFSTQSNWNIIIATEEVLRDDLKCCFEIHLFSVHVFWSIEIYSLYYEIYCFGDEFIVSDCIMQLSHNFYAEFANLSTEVRQHLSWERRTSVIFFSHQPFANVDPLFPVIQSVGTNI